MQDLVTPVVAWGCVYLALHITGSVWKGIVGVITKGTKDVGLGFILLFISLPFLGFSLYTLYKLAVHGSALLRAYF